VNLVLAKNPELEPALLALAAGAEAAIDGGEITAQVIKGFVDTIASRHPMDSETKLILASAIDDVVKLYQDTYGTAVVSGIDPNVRLYLSAFANGIREGIAFRRAITGEQ